MTNEARIIEFKTSLIKCVKSFPALYEIGIGFNNNGHHQRKQIWQGIAEQLKTDEKLCSKTWKTIRERYFLILKRELLSIHSPTIIWPYYEMCSFLRKHTTLHGHLQNLIKIVRIYPILYDKNETGYGNPDQVKLIWPKIAKQISSTPGVCAREWADLYNKYIYEHIKESKRMLSRNFSRSILRKWVYFEDLAFLRQHMDTDYVKEKVQKFKSLDSIRKTITTIDSDTIDDNISNCSNYNFQDDFCNRPPVLCDKIILSDTTNADNNIKFIENVVKLDHNYGMEFLHEGQEPEKELDSFLEEIKTSINCTEKKAVTSENDNMSNSPTTTLSDDFNLQRNSDRQQSESENTISEPNNIERSIQMEIIEDGYYCTQINTIAFLNEEIVNNIPLDDQQKGVSTISNIMDKEDMDINVQICPNELELSSNMNTTDFTENIFPIEEDIVQKSPNILKERETLQNLDDKIVNVDDTNIPCDIKFFTKLVACKITDLPETYRNNVIRQIKQYLEII